MAEPHHRRIMASLSTPGQWTLPKTGAFKGSRSLAARLARRCSYFASDFELDTLPSMTPQPIHSHSSRRRW
jgi:hypothetical protein